ncbi:Uncharacterised protein [Amycolatopsis camponoti]|uniref:Uncharacterized protein n=1 Tax=Amycolatopsis camponoti TaxID=2606593 RepID=A0A6I8M3Q4_9PSEU|nr:hypothetical protein [Amycolatopsis camponoti]VVJ23361.1 Uncharacterised protein [Amycolatopsis camponoti]
MSWITPIVGLLGTFLGAFITWWTERRRWRREQHAKRVELRRVIYGDYLAALHAASEGIREVSETDEAAESRLVASREAFRVGKIYAVREQVELLAPDEVVKVAKLAFRQLRALRDLAGAEEPRKSRHYNPVLVEYGVILERLRNRMREDLDMPAIVVRKSEAAT